MKHGRTKQRRDRQYLFERCLETWLSESPELALRMLAAHIGGLRHDVDELQREMRRIKRDETGGTYTVYHAGTPARGIRTDRPKRKRQGGKKARGTHKAAVTHPDKDRVLAPTPRRIYRSSTWPVLPIATVTVTSVDPGQSHPTVAVAMRDERGKR